MPVPIRNKMMAATHNMILDSMVSSFCWTTRPTIPDAENKREDATQHSVDSVSFRSKWRGDARHLGA